MGGRGHEKIDIEGLVAELEGEAAELRDRLGPSRVPPVGSVPRPVGIPAGDSDSGPLLLGDLAASLGRLRDLADPRGGSVESHRGLLAGPVLALKRLLFRLLTPIWDQQTSFDRAVVDQLAEIGEAISSNSRRLDARLTTLESRIVALQDDLERASDGARAIAPEFDYERFEDVFRGDPAKIREAQRPYLRYFADATAGPVLDLGCGDGTLLSLLREAGVEARGVDRSAGAVQRAQAAGLDATEGDLLAVLEACPDGSLGGVVAIQVVEHLTLPVILQLLRVAKRKLRPGGVFLAETVNLASLITFSRSWTIDPTHRQALHPLTMRFLVEEAGFSEIELIYSGEVEPEKRMESPPGDTAGARNASILNDVVFGPQDYAVVGRA